jgi:ubiquitin-protein ligase
MSFLYPSPFRSGKKKKTPDNGTGYGGDPIRDLHTYKKGRAKALKADQEEWKEQETLLQSISREEEPSEQTVNAVRQVLKRAVPSEWEQRRSIIEIALDVCQWIADKYPQKLGNSEDEESLVVSLEELAQQAELMNQHTDRVKSLATKRNRKGKVARIDDAATDLIHKVLTACNACRQAAQRPELSMLDSRDFYRQTLGPLRFALVESLQHHYFIKNKQSTKLDLKKLFTELTAYQSALPVNFGSSLFVRALESRLDLLRVAIIGPEDTPYSNGIFIFDIWLEDYPHNPPKVQFINHGGRRFNPNLYENGKVCLSLLGTWLGPGWIAGESTLLQVLISIQSLIFV